MMKNFYTDGIYVGYRHYDKNNITPRYEFGYGLSYAKFNYSDLSVTDLGDKLQVSYLIKNVSNVDGKEISQIYMYSPATEIDRPVKELIGYDKTLIKAGETVKINVTIDKEVMCYFDVNTDAFKFEKGTYQIAVGASSRDIKLREKIEL
jgi:beta-glucosidase